MGKTGVMTVIRKVLNSLPVGGSMWRRENQALRNELAFSSGWCSLSSSAVFYGRFLEWRIALASNVCPRRAGWIEFTFEGRERSPQAFGCRDRLMPADRPDLRVVKTISTPLRFDLVRGENCRQLSLRVAVVLR